jgi:hypothetical protein
MNRATVCGLCLALLGPLTALGQNTDPQAVTDTSLVGQLQSEVNWRRVIRIHTADGRFELEGPQLTVEGLRYEEAEGVHLVPERSLLLPDLFPLTAIDRIEVREGVYRWLGMGIGTGMGVLLAAVLAEPDYDDGNISVILVPIGAILGFLVGEAIYEWVPIYERGRLGQAQSTIGAV